MLKNGPAVQEKPCFSAQKGKALLVSEANMPAVRQPHFDISFFNDPFSYVLSYEIEQG